MCANRSLSVCSVLSGRCHVEQGSPEVGQNCPSPLMSVYVHTAPAGLCALCPNSNNSLMVYPSRGIGRVELVDLGTQESEAREIVAHETAITCIALNLQGTRAATASEKVLGSVLNAYIRIDT